MGIVAEEWRPVVGQFAGWPYEVSSGGELRGTHPGRETIRKPCVDRYGYFALSITNGSEKRNIRVHRLVADAFLPGGIGQFHVNHRNGNKRDNRAINLELVTLQENHAHASRTGLRDGVRKLTSGQADTIKKLLERGVTQTFLARWFCVAQGTISDISRGRSYRN